MRSPSLLLIRMNAADTSASSAIADWTPLAVVSRSVMTAEIDTFIKDVSKTRTNIAIARRIISRRLPFGVLTSPGPVLTIISRSLRTARPARRDTIERRLPGTVLPHGSTGQASDTHGAHAATQPRPVGRHGRRDAPVVGSHR